MVVYQEKTEDTEEIVGGIGEEDIVYIVLPYIRSAREGVKRLGSLLEQYGTYEMNASLSRIWMRSGGWRRSAHIIGSPDVCRMMLMSLCQIS